MTKHVLIVSLRLRLTFDTHRYASQTSRRHLATARRVWYVSGMRLSRLCLSSSKLSTKFTKCQLFYFWEIGDGTL